MKTSKVLKLKNDDVWPLVNILNEICNGIHINNFETCISVNENYVLQLLRRLAKRKNEEEPVVILSDLDLSVINNALNEVYKQIDDWEFQTRIGVTRPEIEETRKKIMTQRSDPSVIDSAKKLDETWLQCPKCSDAWETPFDEAVVICPNCNTLLRDPRCQELN